MKEQKWFREILRYREDLREIRVTLSLVSASVADLWWYIWSVYGLKIC